MISILFASALASQSIPNPVVFEFGRLCASGQPSVAAIVGRAGREGWHRTGSSSELSKITPQGRLVLKASDDESAGEKREVCSVSIDAVLNDTVQSAQALLGFKPAVDLGTAATFFAVRDPRGWQSGGTLSRSAFAEAKSGGRFFSIMAALGEYSTTVTALHVLAAPTAGARELPTVPAAAGVATNILRHLDLDSFPNSTGPRRTPALHTPVDYGLTSFQSFSDGWAQASEPDDGWHMSALLLEGPRESGIVCFVDAGGKGATYRATQVLHIKLEADGRWTATQIADRPGCRNDPALKTS